MSPGGTIQYLKHSGKVQRECEVVEKGLSIVTVPKNQDMHHLCKLMSPLLLTQTVHQLMLAEKSFNPLPTFRLFWPGHQERVMADLSLATGVLWQRRKSLLCSFLALKGNLKMRWQFGPKSWSEDTLKMCHFVGKHWESRGVGIRHTVGCAASCLPLGLPVLPEQTTPFLCT